MRAISDPVEALVYDHDAYTAARCWTFYLATGTVRWTSAGANVTFGGNTWLAGAVGISSGQGKVEVGTVVDSMEIELAGTISLGGAPMTQAALGLAFAGARVTLEVVVFDAPYPSGVATGSVLIFDGKVYGCEPGSLRTRLLLKGPFARADQGRGLRVVSAPCPFVVYGAECGATPDESAVTVASGSTTTRVKLAAVPAQAQPGALFTFASGVLSGVAMRIRSVGADYVDVERPLASAPVAAVTGTVRRGCNHALAGCAALNNTINFGGAPWAPIEDLVGGFT